MNIVIVGTNYITYEFIESAKYVKDLNVIGCLSRSKAKAISYCQRFNLKYPFNDPNEMIKTGLVDAVYLAIPNSEHYKQAKFYLEHKIAVLLEKPFTLDDALAKSLIETSIINNTLIMDALVPLYTENFINVKKALSKVGKIHKVDLMYSQFSLTYAKYLEGELPNSYRLELGNGSLMALGVYEVGVMLALFGKPKKILATSKKMKTGVDLSTSMIFVYDDFDAYLNCSRGVETKNLSEIAGEDGQIYFSTCNRMDDVYYIDRKTNNKIDLAINKYPSFVYELKEFSDLYHQNKLESALLPHSLTIDIMEVLTEIRKLIDLNFT